MYLPLLSANPDRLVNYSAARHNLHSTSVPFAHAKSETAPSDHTVLSKVVWEPVMCGDMVVYVRRAL